MSAHEVPQHILAIGCQHCDSPNVRVFGEASDASNSGVVLECRACGRFTSVAVIEDAGVWLCVSPFTPPNEGVLS